MTQLQNRRFVHGRPGLESRSIHTKDLKKLCMTCPRLAFGTLGKSVGVKNLVMPDGQPTTVAFTVLAQLWPKG